MKWIIAISLLIGAGIFSFIYLSLNGYSSSPLSIQTNSSTSTEALSILHQYKDGVHRYGGTLKLPHSCYRLNEIAELDPRDSTKVNLKIQTTDLSSGSTTCAQITTRYPFDMLIDQHNDLVPTLYVDDKEVPIVSETATWLNPRGSILNKDQLK